MKINCVIVTYNRLSLLKECLEAVKQQTFPINQTIIVDNCSTDETGDFLKQFENEENIQVIRTEKKHWRRWRLFIRIKISRNGRMRLYLVDG